jgi:hypothetical protein
MRTTFTQRVTRVVELFFGPEPVGAAGMSRLAGYNQRALSGTGTRPYWGLSGSPEKQYAGAILNPQSFVGGTQMGAQGRAVPIEQAVALPNARLPKATADSVSPFADYLSYEGGS